MEFEIKKSEPHDIPQIIFINEKCSLEEISSSLIERHISDENTVFLSACHNGEAVGYIESHFCLYGECGEGEIIDIAVLPEYRRHGIAEALLKNVIENFTLKNITEIFLEVRESNEPAKALYEKYGFLSYGRRKNYYSNPREDCILMKREKK